ncbi:MAG: helix-turn-helix transcriptional regulator [Treponema sp.]|nr:helix-turn-helix transcriptional regulator [Treponema sp.]
MSKTMGTIICEARKNKGMTQSELAQAMNVTDKAVSKWERDLSCPDVASLSKLAETLGISIEELMSGKSVETKKTDLVDLVCTAVGFAMGVAVVIITMLSRLNLSLMPIKMEDLITMLGVGLVVFGISKLRKQGK